MLDLYEFYLNDNSNRIFLKYDGKRKEQKYTIALLDKNNPNKSIIEDTDEPFKSFRKISKKMGIEILENSKDYIYDNFINLCDKLIEQFGNTIVLHIFLDVNVNLNLMITIEIVEKAVSYKNVKIENLDDIFIEIYRSEINRVASKIIDEHLYAFKELAK